MSYNQYGGNPYRPPPGYGGYGNLPPGMGIPPPGLGPPPGISPGVPPHLSTQQSSRPGALPGNFQPPASMPNINFNAPVIRMGTVTAGSGGRGDGTSASAGSRPGVGMERSSDQGRDRVREAVQSLVSPTIDEKLRTLVLYPLPEGLGGDHGIYKICNAVGRLQKWEPSAGLWSSHSPRLGFALFEDHDSVAIAIKLLREQTFEVPLHQQKPSTNHDQGETFDDIEKTRLKVSADETMIEYHASLQESGAEDADFLGKLETARAALKQVQRDLFFPPPGSQTSTNGAAVASSNNESQGNVEVVNISIAQDDELADIPVEMREIVAQEIAAFRDRSNQRDMERQKREDEIGARFRLKNGVSTPSLGGANNIPLGPRATTSASAAPGPRGQDGHDRALSFANGRPGHADPELPDDSDVSDASDAELARRKLDKEMREEDERFAELEHKWLNRERSRQSALDREQGRERQDAEQKKRRQEDQLNRELGWDDNVEEARKVHLYYRDHANWARVRASDRQEEDTRDDEDRREEEEEKRLEQAQLERARGQADTFLDHQDQEPESHQAAAEPRRFKLSLGAAAQKAQASRAMPQRRTIAEVEGLLDDEDAEPSVRRQLVPIQMDAASGPGAMTEEEISQAVRALAQEIPSDKDGIWAWDVKWDYMDESIVRDRLRPFVEKKIVEYLGVQEEMLVAAVEEHLRKHGTAADLVAELAEALDDEAEELVKKFWRMVIFFTECEKRNLPT